MAEARAKIAGVLRGIVTDNRDPRGLGRVRVSVPELDAAARAWAPVAVAMAGDRRGTYFLPEVGDAVLVAFEGGDARRPYVVGALWTETARPPEDAAGEGNDRRVIRSRSGHLLRFDDTPGAERIELVAGSGRASVAIDSAGRSIVVESAGDVTIRSTNGTLRLEGARVEIESRSTLRAHGSLVEITADGVTRIAGAIVRING